MEPNNVTQVGTEAINFVHPMIQAALLIILPILMQGLKKIVWIEQNKAWVCPLLCIVIATAAAYYMQLPQWLLIGITTGATCNKLYDWAKGAKRTMLIILLGFMVVAFIGCVDEISMQERQCLVAQNTFTTVVQGLTLYKDNLTPEQKEMIDNVIHQGGDYLTEWNNSFDDPNIPPKDWLTLTNDVLIRLLEYQKKGGNL